MQKFLKLTFTTLFVFLSCTIYAQKNPYPIFNKYIRAFTYDQIYCKSNFTPNGLKLIGHYFKYAISICNNDPDRFISDPKLQKAYNYYLNKAKKGDGQAAYKAGVACLMGFGTDNNLKNTFTWLKKSADTDYLLGLNLYAGIIVKKLQFQPNLNINNLEKEQYKLFLKAAKKESPIAYAYLIPYYAKKNHKRVLYWFNKAKKINHPEIIKLRAAYYYNGQIVPKNLKKSLNLYKQVLTYKNAAIPCIQNTLSSIGDIYFFGTGVKKGLNQAYYYYHQAALINDAYAQSKLGDMYCHGLGVKKDQEKANYWYHLAWQHGYPNKVCK